MALDRGRVSRRRLKDSLPVGPGKNLLERSLENADIVVDHCLLFRGAIVTHEAYESEIFVDLAQVQIIVSLSFHRDQRLGIVVSRFLQIGLAIVVGPIPAVDLAHINDHVDVIRTYLVASNIRRACVRRDVDLAHDVEQVCLLDLARAA